MNEPEQCDLLEWVPRPIDRERRRTPRPSIERRYELFVAANPHVFVEALRLARERLDRGERRIGVKSLWEDLRRSIETKKLGAYRFDNSYTAILARKLIEADPRLGAVIELRVRKARS